MSLRINHKFSSLLAACCLLANACLFSQDSLPSKKIFINFNAYYGFIIAHHENMDYVIKHHVPAGEIDLMRITNGEKHWQKVYKNPEMGLGIFFAYTGNPQQLGDAIGIFPFLNFPLNPKRRFKLYLKVSDGLGLITKPFNINENHKNDVNSTYINAFIGLRLNSVFYPGKKIRMETGVGLTHLSNGAWAVPNYGMNIATINLGIGFLKKDYQVTNTTNQNQHDTTNSKVQVHKYFLTLTAAAGPNQTTPPGGKELGGYMFSASGWKNVSEKSRLGLGAETFYDYSNIVDATRSLAFDTNKPLNNLQVGLKFGYEMVIGKIGLPLEMGGYVFSKTTAGGPFYHRIGIRYYINKHLIINSTLKTQWVTAENLEFGLGYRF
ncbi:MAG: acyloxyacyl hydrolase [Bacteroidia bacterium]